MCNLYRLETSIDALRQLFGASAEQAPNLPARADIYPGRMAPVVTMADGRRVLGQMRWGVPPPPGVRQPVTNVRNLGSGFWRPMLGVRHRALVPVSSFCEWSATPDPATGRKVQYWFGLRSAPVFAFAGLWRAADDGPRFAFLTSAPNATVGAVHPKAMPVVLDMAHAARWLDGAPAADFQQPWPDSDMEIR
jgi:putative SOS response-associated peptidase YedK